MYIELMKWRRRQHLIFFGYSDAEIARLGDLGKLTDERMNELIHSDKLETTEKTCNEPIMTAPIALS
jgi:NAD-specific glutamate dehydrogenase